MLRDKKMRYLITLQRETDKESNRFNHALSVAKIGYSMYISFNTVVFLYRSRLVKKAKLCCLVVIILYLFGNLYTQFVIMLIKIN